MSRPCHRDKGGRGSTGRPGSGSWARFSPSGRAPPCAATARYREGMPADRKDKPVVLSRIYTRTGDGGSTALGDGTRVDKNDPRLVAYADVDEANCAIGT